MRSHQKNDPRAELLSIVGALSAAAGLSVILLLRSIKGPIPDPIGGSFVVAFAIVLTIGGLWLVFRRRWAGMLIAAISILTAATYLALLTRCDVCSAGVLLANIVIALLFAAPGALIIRLRRLLQ